jgi:cobalt-zinc-cadmium efflux system outer membrane protein
MADRSPALAAAATDIAEARGKLEQAGKYAYNPALSGSTGPVFGPPGAGTVYDFEVGLSQAFELGGKRSARKAVARAERDAAVQSLEAERIAVHAEVRRAYQLALVADARFATATENEAWARQFQDAAR